ncbi:thermostable carboxypeptidase 1 [Geomicrobium sp. JCM 19055]|nr:thermostable carboxypeptidase 1 [Geomicrobium sp. JCM 19055]
MDTGHTSLTVAIQPDDVRIAFPYATSELRNVFPKLFSEAGEASFSQNYETLLQGETDPSTKLAHRLLFEKFIGKSEGFWQLNYADIQKRLSPTLDHVSYEQFYEAINAVDFTIVKSEASEVMQPLHLLMRYEIEKAVINGEVATKELQNIWAEKSGEHLSLLTPHDLGGILQEDNFATGSFGAPGFELLSYMNAASMYQKLSQETKSWQNEDVKSWLQNNAYNVDGSFSPQALRKQDDLSAYLKVMEERFVPLYQN